MNLTTEEYKKQERKIKLQIDALYREHERELGVLAYEPHEVQKKVLYLPNRIKCMFTGNRVGKSYHMSREICMLAIGEHPVYSEKYGGHIPVPCRLWVSSLDFAGVRDITMPLILGGLPQSMIADVRIADRIVKLTNGSIIGFKSNDSGWQKYQGTSMHAIWLDEEHDFEVFNECKMRLIDTDGIMLISATPTKGMTWMFTELYEQKDTGNIDVGVVEGSMDDNPYLSEDSINEMMAGLSEQEIQIRRYGKFVELQGLIFPNYKTDVHVIDDFDVSKDWKRVLAVDLHLQKPTAVLWVAFDRDGTWYIYRAMKVGGDGSTIRDIAKNIRIQTGAEKIEYGLIEAATLKDHQNIFGVDVLQEMAKEGVYLLKGTRDVETGIHLVRELLGNPQDTLGGSPRLKILKSAAFNGDSEKRSLDWEFKHFRYARPKGDVNAYSEKIYKHDDDFIDCIKTIALSNPNFAHRPKVKRINKPLDRVTGY
ncbi:MAG: hypothetical protein GF347_03145 [Candidatus Moranbacteria bacterium]|nr:hypothetical protein [Candidatus Moranbacteria bacterium]